MQQVSPDPVSTPTETDVHDAPRVPKLGGFVPFSSCDWPDRLAAVVFISGCPWRCRYCHNPHLQTRSKVPEVPSWDEIISWLGTRRGLLDGLVFCGGEPLAEPCLPAMMQQVKDLGFGVALHTGGSYPQRLRDCLPYVDWIGFDVKAPFPDYARITGAKGSGEAAVQSLRQIIESKIAFECRTTIHQDLLSDADLLAIGHTLAEAGIQHYALQKFRTQGCSDEQLLAQSAAANYPSSQTLNILQNAFGHFTLRKA
jgi:pyruvate formate lyase activating enzyme